MKRYILALIVAGLMLASTANAANTVCSRIPPVSGLRYYADYQDGVNGADADYSVVDPTTTVARSAGNLTYIATGGTVTTIATANIARLDAGFWNGDGFISEMGLRVEAAAKNRCTYSETPENAAWTKTDITADNDDAGSSSPDGVATANSLTATAANGTFTQGDTDAVAGVYCASLWIKRKTGTGTINLRGHTSDSYTAINVTSDWTRVFVITSSQTNATFDLQIVTSGDAVYVYGMQLEKNSLMTSYVPSATTAVTRAAETISCANPFTDVCTVIVKVVPNFADSTKGDQNNYVFSTSTNDNRMMRSAYTQLQFYPNYTDTSTSSVPTNAAEKLVALTPVVFAATAQHETPYASFFRNGQLWGNSQVDTDYNTYTTSTSLYLGSYYDGTGQWSGLICKLAVFDRVLTEKEIKIVTDFFNR